jgi:hypothetical protein
MRKAIESLLPGGEDIEILIIDEARKCLHRRTIIELRDSPNEKAKRRITELPLVVRLCSEFGCEYMIQLLIISFTKRLVVRKLINRQHIAHIA